MAASGSASEGKVEAGVEQVSLTPTELKRFLPAAVIRNTGNGKVAPEKAMDKRCNALSFSDNGQYLAASFNDRCMKVIRCDTGEVEAEYSHALSGCQSVTFTHHQEFVLCAGQYARQKSSGTRGLLMYHSLHENVTMRVFKGHISTVTNVAMCPGQDSFFSCGLDGQFFKWDINSPNPVFRGEAGYPTAVLPDGSFNQHIEKVRGQDIHSAPVGCPAVACDSAGVVFAVASPDHTVALFDVRQPHKPFSQRRVTVPSDDARLKLQSSRPMTWQGMSFSNDNKFLTLTCKEHGVIVLDASPSHGSDSLSLVTAASTHGTSDCGCAVTPDSRYLITGSAQGLVWAYDLNEIPARPTEDDLAVSQFAAMEYARELKSWVPTSYPLGSGEGVVALEEGGASLTERTKHAGSIEAVAVHPTRALIASADSSVALWIPAPKTEE